MQLKDFIKRVFSNIYETADIGKRKEAIREAFIKVFKEEPQAIITEKGKIRAVSKITVFLDRDQELHKLISEITGAKTHLYIEASLEEIFRKPKLNGKKVSEGTIPGEYIREAYYTVKKKKIVIKGIAEVDGKEYLMKIEAGSEFL